MDIWARRRKAGNWNKMADKFQKYIDEFYSGLKPLNLKEEGIFAEKTALISVDMVKGFCSVGPLASPLVAAIIPNIVSLFEKVHTFGIQNFLLFQDTHHPETPEFGSFPPHCLKGGVESETIDELKSLSFSDKFTIFEKNSLSPAFNTRFDAWISKNRYVENFIIVGNCTDLCIYSHAMHLRLAANAFNLNRRVIVPENCTVTYDLPVEAALKIGAMPHEAEMLHKLFLYHLSLNGVEIISYFS